MSSALNHKRRSHQREVIHHAACDNFGILGIRRMASGDMMLGDKHLKPFAKMLPVVGGSRAARRRAEREARRKG